MDVDEGNNNHPAILKDILHTRFPCLKVLSLGKNSISSIEGVEGLMMPGLIELYLCKDYMMKSKTTSPALGV